MVRLSIGLGVLACLACGRSDGGLSLSCPEGQTACGATCVDVQADRAHCGSCEASCLAGEMCVAGQCSLSCQAGLADCQGVCANLLEDPAHCGDCDTQCPPGNVCSGGGCALSCQEGLTDCDGRCTDLQTDRTRCGDCVIACGPGRVCVDGLCTLSCPTGLAPCGDTCANLQNDPIHCGRCDTRCTTAQFCSGGHCYPGCLSPLVECGGSCVDLRFDPDHCGACMNKCPTPPHATRSCWNGTCGVGTCEVGLGLWTNCNGDPKDGCETDLRVDRNNCGYCGSACPQGYDCRNTLCVLLPKACDANTPCPPGQRCFCATSFCIPDSGTCVSDELCQNDTFCDSDGCGAMVCIPYGLGPLKRFDPACLAADLTGHLSTSSDNGGQTCLSLERMWAEICNRGAFAAPAGLAGTFYRGDPSQGGTQICTTHTLFPLDPGTCETVWCDWRSPPQSPQDVWFQANDDGVHRGILAECKTRNDLLIQPGKTCRPSG